MFSIGLTTGLLFSFLWTNRCPAVGPSELYLKVVQFFELTATKTLILIIDVKIIIITAALLW